MTAKDHRFDRYSITEMPFGAPNGKPYLNDERKAVLKRLDNFLRHRGFAVLTGPVGAGKSSLLDHFRSKLNGKTHQVVYSPFSILGEGDFLRTICKAMNVEATARKGKMIEAIQNAVRDVQPVNVVMILDEAQKLSADALELVRSLANFEFDGKNLFSVIFAGSNEFLQTLRLRILEPLRQRITLFERINPLNRDETAEYVRHAFDAVGASQDVVETAAVTLVHDLSRGVPRLIDSLARTALEAAADEQAPLVSIEHVRAAEKRVLLPERDSNYD